MDTGEIQALDELGRWEAAKIIRELEDGKFLVRFIGWGKEFDSELPESKIRPAVHPFVNGVVLNLKENAGMPSIWLQKSSGRERGGKGKSFFPIPNPRKHPEKRQLAEMWLHKIGTGHTVKKFNFGPRKLVCEDHFEKSCYVEDIRAKILGCQPRKRLKDDAVPTIFVHRKPAVNLKRLERCTKRSAKKEPSSRSVETQTENSFFNMTTTDCQTEETRLPPKSAAVVLLDHSYCSKVEGDPVCPETHQQQIEETDIQECPLEDDDGHEGVEMFEFVDDERSDPTYYPEPEFPITAANELPTTGQVVHEKKFIVFESALDQLFDRTKCEFCDSSVIGIKKHSVGSGLLVTLSCIDGHEVLKWASQPVEGKMPLGNLLCAAATTFSGLTYQRLKSFASFFNLAFFSAPVYNQIQRNFLIPEVNSFWSAHQNDIIESLQGVPVDLAGDGRCDSPGYSAKYCSYSLMDVNSEKIVDLELVQCSETGSSVRMEAEAFQRSFKRVRYDLKLNVARFASDRHTSIRKICRTEFSDVLHNFDLFHLAKNISNSLRKAAKLKSNGELELWIKSVSNHLWYCSRNCNSDIPLLVEMWKSILYHVSGIHSWPEDNEFKVFRACNHAPLSDEEQRKKKWLKQGSSSHEALCKIVTGKRLLQDLPYIGEFMHTGALEVFHNVVLKYAPKRLEFNFAQMDARLKLAALDHNLNVGRAKAVVKKPRAGSSPRGETQYKRVFTKFTKQWVLKTKYEDKCYDYVYEMMDGVVNRKKNNQKEEIRKAPSANIAPCEAPSKMEMVMKHQSRFQGSNLA
ncbi:hypothetical protein HOLleu_03116 [Holothuria leucospilota]|uniref:THAP-type domain-containing protein n=1 Tax=Holothuria leucospilota TaxID=206669 RepID=A0A9Q1CS60_HOLLE|nr:hypothetical protein HOLleu_03116 [Holothuria leucospilota]